MNSHLLLQALEFAHYAERFRDQVFVVALPQSIPFQTLLPDIKVLTGYHIRTVLVADDTQAQLAPLVHQANSRGTRFDVVPSTGLAGVTGAGATTDLPALRQALGRVWK